MKLVNLITENRQSITWPELSIQKLRDLGYDNLKGGITLPGKDGPQRILWGAAIVSTGRQEAAAMRSAEAKLSRYKQEVERHFKVDNSTIVTIHPDGMVDVEGVENPSPQDLEKKNKELANLKAKDIERFGTNV